MSNYYKPGPNSDKKRVEFIKVSYARSGATSWGPSKWYIADNVAEGLGDYTADNWKGVARDNEKYSLDELNAGERIVPVNAYYRYSPAGVKGRYTPADYMLTDIEPGENVLASVVAKAGTVNPDKVERRLLEEAAKGTTTYVGSNNTMPGIIDNENDAEGFYEYAADYTVAPDTDGDGLPDAWELKRASSLSEIDNNTILDDGYTALEVYLNELMGDYDNITSITDVIVDSSDDAPVEYYTLQGVRVRGELSSGLYVRRQGAKAEKVIVR